MTWWIWFLMGLVLGYLLRELEIRGNLWGQEHTKQVRDKDAKDFGWGVKK